MLKVKSLTRAILIAGIGVSAPAMAADPVFYTGINAGWNATEFKTNSSVDLGGNITESEETGSASAPVFGGVAGIKFQNTQNVNGQQTLDQKISSNLSYGVSGILAFNVNAHSQIYGIAGYQMTDVEVKTSTRDTGTGDVTNDSYNDDFGGFRVGIGLETAMTSALSTRIEWTRTSYGSEDFETNTANGVVDTELKLSLIHISEPTRRTPISYAVF